MIKKITIVILLLSLVIQCLQSIGFTGLYLLNKQQIANKFCQNKSKPLLHCNGKCHLRKQVAKSAKEREDKASNSNNINTVVFVVEPFQSFVVSYSTVTSQFVIHTTPPLQGFQTSIFHPPLA